MNHKHLLYLVHAAIIAALYIVLTIFAATLNLASGAIQVRFSEALTILPFFTPAAVPGVVVGCLLSNILTGCALPDIIFGTLATLLGALGTRYLRKNRWICALPPIIANAIIVPLVLIYAYGVPGGFPYLALTVGAGEVISILIIGEVLLTAIKPYAGRLFTANQNI